MYYLFINIKFKHLIFKTVFNDNYCFFLKKEKNESIN